MEEVSEKGERTKEKNQEKFCRKRAVFTRSEVEIDGLGGQGKGEHVLFVNPRELGRVFDRHKVTAP